MFHPDEKINKAVKVVLNSPVSRGRGVILSIDNRSKQLKTPPEMRDFAEFVVIQISKKGSFEAAGGWKEAGLATINCTAAVIATLFTFGAASTTVFSGGLSTPVTYAGYAATAATGAACFNSAARTYNAAVSPEKNSILDASPRYKTAMNVIDGVSMIGVGTAALTSVKILKILKNSGVRLSSALRVGTSGLNRQAQQRLARQVSNATRGPMSNKQYKSLVKLGTAPKRISNVQISAGMAKTLMDNVAAALSFASSAADGHIYSFSVYVVGIEN